MLRLRLLGPIDAALDGRPVALGPTKQRAVLAILALHVNRTVPVDRLIEGLWGDEPPASAPKMVQLYVSQLRRLLNGEGPTIVTRGRGYELCSMEDAVDAARFERLVAKAAEQGASPNGAARAALALWRGPPLADVVDEPFAAAQIRRLEELHLRASELAIEGDLAAGRHREVIGELDALVAAHPLSERLHAQRMLALYRSGRQAEALEAYSAARRLLVQEIGVEPGPDLRALQQAVLRHDPALAAQPGGPAAANGRPAPPRARTGRRRRLVALAGALVVVLAVGMVAMTRPSSSDLLAGIDENAVGVLSADAGGITAQYPVGRGPSAITAGGGSVWIANALDGTVSRIEPAGDRVATIHVDGTPAALAFARGSLWVADGDGRTVAQVDPGQNKVIQQIDVGNAPRAVAAAAGSLWVASGVDGMVHRVDLTSGRVSGSIAIGSKPTAITAGAGAVWAASEEAGIVARIDPQSETVVQTIHVGNGPSALAAGAGAVWVVNRDDGTVSRIDPRSNRVSGLVHVGGNPTAVTAGPAAVWVAGEKRVARIDPRAPRVVQTIDIGSRPVAVAMVGNRVWTAAHATHAAHRGGTLRVLMPEPVSLDWLSPAAYTWGTAQVSPLVYEGLVAYRRVGGAGGAELVGALATRAPPPSPDGRTYVFTLRAGSRYSDGTPVRAEDVRVSMERFLRVTRRAFPPFFASIMGAERCVDEPARCDLSEGIRTDSRTRTVTIHLVRPDADFLHKLTIPFAYVVPAGTPLRGLGDRPPPGTGPYRIARWDGDRGGVLVRNRHFRARSGPDGPPGFADRIEISTQRLGSIEGQVADVQRGTADVAVLVDPFNSHLDSPQRLIALAAQSPGQLHSVPTTTTEWMFLNVRRAPFDDIRVRRALNYAVDRARVVDLVGGRQVASPTCQILASGFPGYEPYCPYSAGGDPVRGWTAPDLDRARKLVAQSGTMGTRVVVWAPTFRRAVGRYFAALLNELGFRATLRVLPIDSYFPAIGNARSRRQIGFYGWQTDYVGPSGFIQPAFTCGALAGSGSAASNVSRLCDRSLERRIERAQATVDAGAARAWAAADHRIVDLAPVVPLTNHRAVLLVSKRVGNVQGHLQSLALLDQFWVR